jgi:hypothetical protein
MERELWRVLYRMTYQLGEAWGDWRYSTADILVVYLWAVVHDRPTVWAAQPENWPPDVRPAYLPSQGTLSRRLRTTACVLLMTAVEQHLITRLALGNRLVHSVDGKALGVSLVSKDPESGYGRGAGGKQKGYKLHAIWADGPMPIAWGVSPMNTSEKRMARGLIESLPGGGYLLGDTQYDVNYLYDAAEAEGFQFVAKKTPNRGKGGLGHRRQAPGRLRSIALLQTPFGRELYKLRRAIEASFGTLVSFGGGLACLPPWVRRFHRVRHWIQAKLIIAGARTLVTKKQMMKALA